MDYTCHQCYRLVAVEDLAHTDLYYDLCWLQCRQCAERFGNCCGKDRRVNPYPHGYTTCPFRNLSTTATCATA